MESFSLLLYYRKPDKDERVSGPSLPGSGGGGGGRGGGVQPGGGGKRREDDTPQTHAKHEVFCQGVGLLK